MENNSEPFIIRGRQRNAVYHALKHPSTGRQILSSARQAAPSMTYQDLRHILRDFEQRGVAICLNPGCQTGRLYVLASAKDSVSISSGQLALCARIGRAKTRLAVLEEVAKDRFFEQKPLTATHIKKLMRERYPLGLNHVLSALNFLEANHLVEAIDCTAKRDLKIYQATSLGRAILTHLKLSEN